jgi:hypothetical protein
VSLLSKLLGRGGGGRVDDPVLGALRRDGTLWHGEFDLEGFAQPVSLNVERGPEGPQHEDRETYTAIATGWPTLAPRIAEALAAAWNRHADTVGAAHEDDASTLLARVNLQGLVLQPGRRAVLLMGFADSDDPRSEGHFEVEVRGGLVTSSIFEP